jgi:hypothetical protein
MSCRIDWVNLDNVITNKPSLIQAILLGNSEDVTYAQITIYDGTSASDPVVFNMKSVNGRTVSIYFKEPLKTMRGIFVEINTVSSECCVVYSNI